MEQKLFILDSWCRNYLWFKSCSFLASSGSIYSLHLSDMQSTAKLPLYIYIRYLLRLFDCLAHPNLGSPFATDQKWPICHLRISYQSLAGGLRSLQKSEFLKLIISFFHYFCSQNWNQWHKMSGKNTHIYFFYFWFKNKRVWAEKNRKKTKKFQKPKSCRQLP